MSLARPGANVTGVTAIGQALNTKRLELIKEAVPGASRVGVIMNPDAFYTPRLLEDRQRAARSLALDLRLFEVREPDNLEAAFAAARTDRMDALLVQTTAFFISTYTHSTEARNMHLQKVLSERHVPFTTALEPRLLPGSVAFLPAPKDAGHRDFLAYAWVDEPLRDLLGRLKGYARR